MATILIVDDQPDTLYVLDRLLRSQGHQVLQADRGEPALEIARRDQPDLILLDVMMPGIDGFEVVRRLRQDAATQSIPVILLTANAPDQRQKIQGLNLGADEYLTQPINNSELLARIRALLRTKQAQAELLAANTQLRALLDVIQAGTSTLDLGEVGRRLVDSAIIAAGAEVGGIWLLHESSLEHLAEVGFPEDGRAERQSLAISSDGPFGRVVAERQPLYGPPAELYGANHPYGPAIKAAIVLPLVHRDAVVGVLQLGMTRERNFSPGDIVFLSAMANAAAASVENARLFEETDHQRQKLQALDSEKDEFISIITHELKNPLASIKGYAGLLTRRGRKDPHLASALKSLDVIEQQVNRMTLLLDQLRDVSQIGINRFAIETQLVDLAALVEHVVSSTETTTSGYSIQLEVKDAPLLATVDEFRIEQVLANLLGNAIKYSPDGGRVEVALGASERFTFGDEAPAIPTGWAVITVKDYGIGIPRAGQERLFERFFRAPNAKGRVSGMGLGLYIAREIVQRHGGLIWVESEEGKGSLFGVALPLATANPEADGATPEPAAAGKSGDGSLQDASEGIA